MVVFLENYSKGVSTSTTSQDDWEASIYMAQLFPSKFFTIYSSELLPDSCPPMRPAQAVSPPFGLLTSAWAAKQN